MSHKCYNGRMDDDTLTDLKQFISATVHQETAELGSRLTNKIDSKIDQLDKKLSGKIDTLSQSIAEAMDASTEATDTQLRNHEHRIGLLEQKAA